MNESPSLDPKQFPEAAKFSEWYAAEKEKGLVDVKFFPGNISKATVESFFLEMNQARQAEELNDPEFI